MILDVAGKKYDIKRKLNVSEVMQVRQKAQGFIGINDRIEKAAAPEEYQAIQKDLMQENEEQDKLVISCLSKCMGKTEAEITEMEYLDAVMLFSALYDESTIIKKNLEQPSQVPSSGTQ